MFVDFGSKHPEHVRSCSAARPGMLVAILVFEHALQLFEPKNRFWWFEPKVPNSFHFFNGIYISSIYMSDDYYGLITILIWCGHMKLTWQKSSRVHVCWTFEMLTLEKCILFYEYILLYWNCDCRFCCLFLTFGMIVFCYFGVWQIETTVLWTFRLFRFWNLEI